MIECPNCGKLNPDDNKFCGECGLDLIKAEIGKKLDFASKLEDEGKIDDAILIYEEIFAMDIYISSSWHSLYNCYSQKYGIEKGIETLKRFISKCKSINCKNAQIWNRLLKEQEHKLEVTNYLNDMDSVKNDVLIALNLWDEGKIEEAIKLLEKSLDQGYYGQDYIRLAYFYHSTKNFEKERDIHQLIIKNAKNSPFNDIKFFENQLKNIEHYLKYGEWLNYPCYPILQLNEAKKLLKTDKREKGIELLEELVSYKCDINEVYYALYLTYNKEKRYEDSLRICDKAIEVLGRFDYRLRAWNKHKDKILPKIDYNSLEDKLTININDLQGIDFANKYYDPSKPVSIVNEKYQFYTEPNPETGSLNYEFISKWHHATGVSTNLLLFHILYDEYNAMVIKEHRIFLISNLLYNYENIDFIQLFIDLTEENKGKSYKDWISHYQKVLQFYGIFENDEDLLNELYYIINDKSIDYEAFYGCLNVESIMADEMSSDAKTLFEIAYIDYLQLIDSDHNNILDKNHYFDCEDIPASAFYHYFGSIDFTCPMDVIKEVAIRKNHIIEGNGVGVLKFRSTVKNIKEALEKHNLTKTGDKRTLINRVINNFTESEINEMFEGNRFVLTLEGRQFLNKQRDFNIYYYEALPGPFSEHDFQALCRENPEYSIEDIIFSIVMHDWCVIENPTIFKKELLEDFINYINNSKIVLAEIFEYTNPEKAKILTANLKETY